MPQVAVNARAAVLPRPTRDEQGRRSRSRRVERAEFRDRHEDAIGVRAVAGVDGVEEVLVGLRHLGTVERGRSDGARTDEESCAPEPSADTHGRP